MAKMKTAVHSEKHEQKNLEFMGTMWNAILINSHLQQLFIIFLAPPCKVEKSTIMNMHH